MQTRDTTTLQESAATAEASEASYLATATTQLHIEAGQVEEQNQQLRDLIARKQALAGRLHALLTEAQSERRSIDQEMKRILRPARRRSRPSSAGATR